MSRIGASPISFKGLSCVFDDNSCALQIKKGPDVRATYVLPDYISCCVRDSVLTLALKKGSARKSHFGMHRSILNSILVGLSEGFVKKIGLSGVGYKAELKGCYIVFSIGYSHTIKYRLVDGVEVKIIKPTEILLTSHDKQLLGVVAADLCRLRKYNPYKGKGIFIEGSFLLKKESSKK